MTKARTLSAKNETKQILKQFTEEDKKFIEYSSFTLAICFSSSLFFEDRDIFRSSSLVSLRRLHNIQFQYKLEHDFIILRLQQLILGILAVISSIKDYLIILQLANPCLQNNLFMNLYTDIQAENFGFLVKANSDSIISRNELILLYNPFFLWALLVDPPLRFLLVWLHLLWLSIHCM